MRMSGKSYHLPVIKITMLLPLFGLLVLVGAVGSGIDGLDSDQDPSIEYLDHSEPNTGPIQGSVHYKNGPREGEGIPGALLELIAPNGSVIGSAYTNDTGSYQMNNTTFGADLTIKASPPANEIGEWDVATGYLPSVSSPFNHTLDSNTSVSFLLNYYVLDPVEVHPIIIIVDGDGDPVPGAVVNVTSGGKHYSAVTDANGEAEFVQFTGEEFPAGSEFTAEASGYEKMDWDQGDEVPALSEMGADDESGSDPLLVLIIFILTVVIILVLILITGKLGSAKPS